MNTPFTEYFKTAMRLHTLRNSSPVLSGRPRSTPSSIGSLDAMHAPGSQGAAMHPTGDPRRKTMGKRTSEEHNLQGAVDTVAKDDSVTRANQAQDAIRGKSTSPTFKSLNELLG